MDEFKEATIPEYWVHVGSIPAKASTSDLMRYFQKFGRIIRVTIPQTRKKYRNKAKNPGCCTLVCQDYKTANAIICSEEHMFQNRIIKCEWFEKGKELKQRLDANNKTRFILKNIPWSVTDAQFKEEMRKYGPVTLAYLLKIWNSYNTLDHDSKTELDTKSRTGSVQFKTLETAIKFSSLKYITLNGHKISVEPYQPNHQRPEPRREDVITKDGKQTIWKSVDVQRIREKFSDTALQCLRYCHIKPTSRSYHEARGQWEWRGEQAAASAGYKEKKENNTKYIMNILQPSDLHSSSLDDVSPHFHAHL